ncbi:MAG: class I SAM-dependent methyltransferase [Sandaracinaceae bacterium]|nr:class I SAM-dependent methyltransferase [Sandaracinaceae bacterium]
MIIERGEFLYGLSAVVHYGTRVLLRGSGTRDVSSILREYDRPRRREEWRDDLSIDDLIRGDSSRREYVLLHDRLVRATERQVRAVLLEGLVCAAHRFVDSAESGTIVEFGCGTGRNLFFLAERFPNARLLGLELSPATVRRASERAAPYDGRVEVRVADMTRPLDLPGRCAVRILGPRA